MRKHIYYLFILFSLTTFLSCENKPKMDYISGLGAPDLTSGTNPLIGKPVEMNWQLKTLSGDSLLLSDFKGKVIFLNLWATWCPPCKAELPSIQKLKEIMGNKVTFLLVSNETRDEINAFFQPFDFDVPAYLIEGELPSDFVTEGIPATYILDKEGKLAAFHLGSAQWDDQTVVDFLNSLQ